MGPRSPVPPLPPGRPRWRKVLYEAQPWPDNYTSPEFLDRLVINDAVPARSLVRVVFQACPVLEHFATVTWVAALTYDLYTGALTAKSLLLRCACFALAGWALTHAVCPPPRPYPASPARAAAAAAQLSLAAALMSPLYATLTRTVSPDSVLAAATGLALAHLYLADYDYGGWAGGGGAVGRDGPAASTHGGLSVAAALAACILVAGRLPGPAEVAAQLLLALLAFVLAPYGRAAVGRAGRGARVSVTALLLAGALIALASGPAGVRGAGVFAAAAVFLGLLCPLWLVRAHKFKAKINGPWDEAVPDLLGKAQ